MSLFMDGRRMELKKKECHDADGQTTEQTSEDTAHQSMDTVYRAYLTITFNVIRLKVYFFVPKSMGWVGPQVWAICPK